MHKLNRFLQNLDSLKVMYGFLIIIAIFILVFQPDNLGFVNQHHGFLSSHGLAIAQNLSFDTNLLMYTSASIDESGKVQYDAYNRFSVVPFAIIKSAIGMFEDRLSAQIYTARQLMNIFMILAMLYSFLIISELTDKPLLSLTVTLLSFCSKFTHYYNDMIFNDVPTLFGIVLIFHGIVVYERHRRLRQLFVKALIGASLGWQAFPVLVLWWLLKTFEMVMTMRRRKKIIRELISSPHTRVVALCVLLGIVLLGYNIINEQMATEKSLSDLMTVKSILFRAGISGKEVHLSPTSTFWWPYVKQQSNNIVNMVLPSYAWQEASVTYFLFFIICIFLIAGMFIWRKNRLVIATMVFSGLLWATLMKNFVVFHDFQSLFYLGIPLVFYMILLIKLPRIAIAVVFIFALILFASIRIDFNYKKSIEAFPYNKVTSDFQLIRDYLGGSKKVYYDRGSSDIELGKHAVDYYLDGNYFTKLNNADYVITHNKHYEGLNLTISNSTVYLFLNTLKYQKL